MPPIEQVKFHSTPAVAKMFDVSNYTIREWIRRGLLTAVKVNGRWKVSQEEVERLGREKYGNGEATAKPAVD